MSTSPVGDTTTSPDSGSQALHRGAQRARARHAVAEGAKAAGFAAAGAVGGAVLASRHQPTPQLTRFGRRNRPAVRAAITKRLS